MMLVLYHDFYHTPLSDLPFLHLGPVIYFLPYCFSLFVCLSPFIHPYCSFLLYLDNDDDREIIAADTHSRKQDALFRVRTHCCTAPITAG